MSPEIVRTVFDWKFSSTHVCGHMVSLITLSKGADTDSTEQTMERFKADILPKAGFELVTT